MDENKSEETVQQPINTPDMTPTPIEQVDPATRLKAKRAAQIKRQEEAARNAEQRKANYAQEKDSPVLLDILTKARQFRDYHTKLAVDGVGARVGEADPETGKQSVTSYTLSPEETFRELGQASGLTQLIVYIENQLA